MREPRGGDCGHVPGGRQRTSSAAGGTRRRHDPEHVTIYAEGGHPATSGVGIIATHRAGWRWAVDAVGETKNWVNGAAPSDMPHVLLVEDDEHVDRLLVDPAFWHSRVAERDERAPPLEASYRVGVDALTPRCAQHRVTTGMLHHSLRRSIG